MQFMVMSSLFETFLVAQGDRGSLVGRGKPSGGFHKRHMVGTLEYLAPEVRSRSAKLDAAYAEQVLGLSCLGVVAWQWTMPRASSREQPMKRLHGLRQPPASAPSQPGHLELPPCMFSM